MASTAGSCGKITQLGKILKYMLSKKFVLIDLLEGNDEV